MNANYFQKNKKEETSHTKSKGTDLVYFIYIFIIFNDKVLQKSS